MPIYVAVAATETVLNKSLAGERDSSEAEARYLPRPQTDAVMQKHNTGQKQKCFFYAESNSSRT